MALTIEQHTLSSLVLLLPLPSASFSSSIAHFIRGGYESVFLQCTLSKSVGQRILFSTNKIDSLEMKIYTEMTSAKSMVHKMSKYWEIHRYTHIKNKKKHMSATDNNTSRARNYIIGNASAFAQKKQRKRAKEEKNKGNKRWEKNSPHLRLAFFWKEQK